MTHHLHIKKISFSLSLLIPSLPLLGYVLHFNWLAPLLVFIVFPVAGLIIGTDKSPPDSTSSQNRVLEDYLLMLPRLWVFLWISALILGTQLLATTPDLSIAEQVGLVFGLAISSAFGTTVGHELVHRRNILDRTLGRLIMAVCGLGHLVIAHMDHHRKAVTHDDTSTPRVKEGLYAFAWRSTSAGLRGLVTTESFSRRRVHELAVNLLILAATYVLFAIAWGWTGIALLIVQALFAMLCFEAINYIQHYGLQRNASEPFSPRHAWSHYCWLTQCLTFNLPLHSDHHLHPDKPYFQLVRNETASPRLPACYMVMFLCALVPPIWRRVMRAPLNRQLNPALQGEQFSRRDSLAMK